MMRLTAKINVFNVFYQLRSNRLPAQYPPCFIARCLNIHGSKMSKRTKMSCCLLFIFSYDGNIQCLPDSHSNIFERNTLLGSSMVTCTARRSFFQGKSIKFGGIRSMYRWPIIQWFVLVNRNAFFPGDRSRNFL